MPTNLQTQPNSQPQEQPEESLDQEETTKPESDNGSDFIAEDQNDTANPDERLQAMDERMGQNLEDVRTAIYGSKDRSKDKEAQNPQADEINQKPDDKSTEDKKPEDSVAKPSANPNQSKADQIKNTIKSGRNKVANTFNRAREIKRGAEAAGDIKDMAADYAKEKVKRAIRDAIVKNAKRVAAQIARSVATAIAGFITANLPIILGALAIIVVIVGIVSLIATFWGFGRDTGRGPAIYPAEARHPEVRREQAMVLSALTDNRIAQNSFVAKIVENEKARYERILENARRLNPDRVEEISDKKAQFSSDLDLLEAASPRARIKMRNDLDTKMRNFENSLPFGPWIVYHAEYILQNSPALQQVCEITGADASRQCASFVSRVLLKAGVPDPISANTMALWNKPFWRSVVERTPPPTNQPISNINPVNPNLYAQNRHNMKPGDIVWWGNGSCSSVTYPGKLFDHVGIYIGDRNGDGIGEIIDTSSTQKRVVMSNINFMSTLGPSCAFNGAKRYGL